MSPIRSLIVGAGGLLGSAVSNELRIRGRAFVPATVPWADPDASVGILRDALVALITESGDDPWSLYWCAGTGVVATGEAEFDAERVVIEAVLRATSVALGERGQDASNGTVFFASSAGATFAGNPEPPFSETSEAVPLAPYGRSKLQLEQAFADWAAVAGARLLVGRISNLYGPGQNIAKPQGLISQLIAARLEDRPSNIYVPMTTVRDYLFVDDAASMIVDAVDIVASDEPAARLLKIFAAQRGDSITEVIATLERVMGRSLDIVSGHDPAAVYQALDLRFRSEVMPGIDNRPLTTLEEGIARTVESLQNAHARSAH